jgi:hypothetical protein
MSSGFRVLGYRWRIRNAEPADGRAQPPPRPAILKLVQPVRMLQRRAKDRFPRRSVTLDVRCHRFGAPEPIRPVIRIGPWTGGVGLRVGTCAGFDGQIRFLVLRQLSRFEPWRLCGQARPTVTFVFSFLLAGHRIRGDMRRKPNQSVHRIAAPPSAFGWPTLIGRWIGCQRLHPGRAR